MRRFWKQHFPRKGSILGLFAFGPGVLGPPGCALCAASIIYSKGGEERGKSFWKSVPLERGADRASLGVLPGFRAWGC